ncbi:MAG: ATP synthase F1 subunit delta, partial [bacterium]|nr:ATP synthase F1 subunit delta [bacterium]
MALAVANRYASALVDVVLEEGSGIEPNRVAEQLRALDETLAASAELRGVLLNPAVPPPRKRALVGRLADMLGVAALVRNFFYVLIDRRRIDQMSEIRQAFEDMLDERMGLVRADVTAAAALGEGHRARLRDELSGLTGKQVRCEFTVDEELLGGAVVQIGSTVYDGSVRGRLTALRDRLVE